LNTLFQYAQVIKQREDLVWGVAGRFALSLCSSTRVLANTNGLGAHSVLECVGYGESTPPALSIARTGGAMGRVGVPQYVNYKTLSYYCYFRA
jgi:threonine dehydrogenase-like Zn-dependent dehydrogenase